MIRSVIFDIGKVLIQFDWDAYMQKLFRDAETRRAVTHAMWENPDWNELDRGVLPLADVVRLFVENAPAYEEQIHTAVRRLGEVPARQEYAMPWVQALKAEGLRVFYLSNYFEYLMKEAPQVLDFIPYMDGGVFSCRENITKPDAEIYLRLLRRYNLRAEECIFVDDTQKNIDAANALGIHGILFTSYEQTSAEVQRCIEENS